MSHPDLLSKLLGQSDQLPARQPRLSNVVPVPQAFQSRLCGQSPNGVHGWDRFVPTFGQFTRVCRYCRLTV